MPLDIDRYSHLTSPLQRWDPRVKIASLAVFVLGLALIKSLPVAAVARLCALILVYLAGLPVHFVAQGVKWVSVFLIPFLLIMPLSYPGVASFLVLGLSFAWVGFCFVFVFLVMVFS